MTETERTKLWEKYVQKKTPELREKLILEYAGVVKLVAGRLSMYLGYTVEYDDLVGYGIFGLIDAIDKFRLEKGVKFETYASLRIRGAILDQIRKMDWIPRTLRQRQRQIENAEKKLEAEYGRPAKEEEIAQELGLSQEEFGNWRSQVRFSSLIYLDDYREQNGEPQIDPVSTKRYEQPEQAIEKQELKRQLQEALQALTEKEMKVITFYYYEELTLKEISRILGVSESRVSQLHTKALQKIRVQLGDGIDFMHLFY